MPSHLPVYETDEVRIHRVANHQVNNHLVQENRYLVKTKLLTDAKGKPLVGISREKNAGKVYFVTKRSQRMMNKDPEEHEGPPKMKSFE